MKKQKYYMLEMFSYPSGANLHAGHWFNFAPADTFARYKKMTGYAVFHPMGFDSFGLPAENYAIKTGIHPKDSTYKNIAVMEQQLRDMGGMYNWENEVVTSDESYYKWTQWLFLKLLEKGLAYRKEAPVNWCPSCATVLANEQAEGGVCDRCKTAVTKKNLTQWFFRITDYAEELLTGIDKLDWPEKTKLMQKNWIGKSEGTEIDFVTENGEKIRVFTTRADTLFGVSYIVLAPEHPLVSVLTTPENAAAVEGYIENTKKVTEIDRLSSAREKTGVPLGAQAIHPFTGEKIPVWTGDYVLYSYGTGAVMGVPAHDERDFAFAKKHGLPVTPVLAPALGEEWDYGAGAFTEYGIMTAESPFKGLKSLDAISAIAAALKQKGLGGTKTNYRLRDWLVSRQRYWGAPIPVVHCPKCGIVPVPEKELPVELPYGVEFKPAGESPLASHEEFMNVPCPKCGGAARRDPDTLDTFVCSSWYYLRYPDNKNDKEAFSRKIIDKMLPVDKYVGGAEHACMHLLYARFVTKALRDMGYLGFSEPFISLVHQGTILGSDGQKMSKSLGNTVNPDGYVAEFGADVFRMYLMFGFDYISGGPWSDDGVRAMAKYFERVERLADLPPAREEANKWTRLAHRVPVLVPAQPYPVHAEMEEELNFVRSQTIAAVRRDIESMSFNTCIAALMKYTNALYAYKLNSAYDDLLLLLAPFAPSFAQRLWEKTGHKTQIMDEPYPVPDEKALVKKTAEIAVQINSKIRGKIVVAADADEAAILERIKAEQPALLEGKTPKKVINVPGRLINIIL